MSNSFLAVIDKIVAVVENGRDFLKI